VHPVQREQPDDVTLSQKVESIAFREAGTPKGHVSVNAERGVVFLRGQLETTEQIDALVSAAGHVEGVKEVRSLLHIAS
jgi:osmotically-inducible protein OsmY